jgi:hypothetical protein
MLALLALTLAGCQVPQLNPGRVSAVAIGAHAGWFRRVNGRWPVDFAELNRLDCPRMDDEYFSDAYTHGPQPARDTGLCNVLSELPYVVTMHARGRDLRVVIDRKKGPMVCSLVVLAPTMASARELSPLIRLKLFSFDCPGEGKAF